MTEENCLFCKIADGRIPAKIVYDRHGVVGFEDINPAAPTHILFIPRKHLASLAEVDAADGELLGRLFAAANEIARARGLAEPDSGYRLVTNVGPQAGQSVLHLHFHLLGGRDLAWPPG